MYDRIVLPIYRYGGECCQVTTMERIHTTVAANTLRKVNADVEEVEVDVVKFGR